MSILSKILGAFQRGTSALEAATTKLESAATKLNVYVERQKQIQAATIDMVSGYELERMRIDAAWNSVERELKLRRELGPDPEARARFDEHRAKLKAKLEEMPGRPESREPTEHKCGDLRPPARHHDPEIATTVEQKYSETVAEYSAFLNDVLRRLNRQKEMRSHFEEELVRFGGAQILERIRAYEAGREWRYISTSIPNDERPASNVGITISQSIIAMLRTLQSTASSAAKSAETTPSSIDMLDAYVQRAKRTRNESFKAEDLDWRRNLILHATKEQEKKPSETTAVDARPNLVEAKHAPLKSDPNSSLPAETLRQRERIKTQTSQSMTADVTTNVELSGWRAEIKEASAARHIPALFHFTRRRNLESILRHGLLSVARAAEMAITPHINDSLRLDGYRNAVSLSIAFPNDRMFYKYRQSEPREEWVMLGIDPAVLWQNNCAFCQRNAADHRIRERLLADLTKVDAFRSMFDPIDGVASREEQRLMEYDPTDPQAEVLVFDLIRPDQIIAVGFDNQKAFDAFSHLLGDRESKVLTKNKGLLGTRIFARNGIR